MKWIWLLHLTTVLLLAENAWAGIEFDFRGNQGTQDSLSFSSGGIDLTVRGFLVTDDPVQVHQGGWGLSVVNTTDPDGDAAFWSDFAVDGKNGAEYLELEFSIPVFLKNLLFASVGAFDTFDLWLDGDFVDLSSLPGSDYIMAMPPSPTQVDLSSLGLLGTNYRLYANNYGVDEQGRIAFDEWQLEKAEVQPIPEPSSVLIWTLLGLVCGVIAWRTRRRRASAVGSTQLLRQSDSKSSMCQFEPERVGIAS